MTDPPDPSPAELLRQGADLLRRGEALAAELARIAAEIGGIEAEIARLGRLFPPAAERPARPEAFAGFLREIARDPLPRPPDAG